MKKNIYIIGFFFFNAIGCLNLTDLPSDYYQDSNNVIGGQKPNPPILLPIETRSDGKYLVWTQSIDPDTNQEVPRYYIYIFYNEIPPVDQIYKIGAEVYNQNLLIHPRQFNIPGSLISGKYFFAVTGYDGDLTTGRESLVSNFEELIIP